MTNSAQNVSSLISRLAFVALFLPAGVSKLTGFSGTVGYIASVGLPLAALGAVVAIVVEIVCSLALLVGVGTRLAALILMVFTLIATFFFHPYWAVPAEQAMVQQLMFYKNIAVGGGLLLLAIHGGGDFSLAKKRA